MLTPLDCAFDQRDPAWVQYFHCPASCCHLRDDFSRLNCIQNATEGEHDIGLITAAAKRTVPFWKVSIPVEEKRNHRLAQIVCRHWVNQGLWIRTSQSNTAFTKEIAL